MEEISLKTLLEDVLAEVQTLSTVRDGSVDQGKFEDQVYQKVKGGLKIVTTSCGKLAF